MMLEEDGQFVKNVNEFKIEDPLETWQLNECIKLLGNKYFNGDQAKNLS